MASGSFGVSTNNGYVSGRVDWSSTADVGSNSSNVTATMYLSRTNSGYSTYGTGWFYITINGSGLSNNLSYTITQNSNTVMVSGTVNVPHNADGTKAITIAWSGGGGANDPITVTYGSGTAYLDNIPRASGIASNVDFTAGTQNLGVNLNVASGSFTHNLTLQVNRPSDGAWVTVASRGGVGSSTTFTFSQTEITNMYSALGGWENRSTLLICDTYNGGSYVGSSQKGGTCYAVDIARATIPTFNIGSSATINITGMLAGFQYTGQMVFGSMTKNITFDPATPNPSITFTTTEINSMYSSVGSANSGIGTLTLWSKYNGVDVNDYAPTPQYDNHFGFTANVAGSNPTFTVNGVTYSDTNTTITNITLNNQYIVQNKSTVRVTIPVGNKATANNGATMASYEATLNGIIKTATYSSTQDVNIDFGVIDASSNITLVIKAIDSRGNSTSQSKTVTIIPYISPVITAKGARTNGFDAETTLTVNGSISLLTISGANKNSIIAKIANPTSAPTLTNPTNASSTLTAGTYYCAYTWYSSLGETTDGTYTAPSIATSSGQNLVITIPSKPTGATGAKIYVGTSSGNMRYQGTTTGTTYTISAPINTTNALSPATNTTGNLQFRYKDTATTTWTLWDSLTFTTSGATYTATDVILTLDNVKAWDFQIQCIDKLSTSTVSLTVGVGQPILFIDSEKKSVGVNKFPTGIGTFETAGDISSGGTLNMNNHNITGANHIVISDAGANEGLEWLGTNNWKIFCSPDDLSNAEGNLQFVMGSTRMMTLGTDGVLSINGKTAMGVDSYGSNANGSYVRYTDGLQICWQSLSLSSISWGSIAVGGSTYYYVSRAWTFPASFVSAPVTFNSGDIGVATVEHHFTFSNTTTGCTIEDGAFGNSAQTLQNSLLAIGRWK